ncbi:hypothetical protein JCGZ_18811 [Jatropha curcas]|uniref:Beta-galactosidase n=1 Tax=Jatropha curcas TaxID=180498 RepID=A0A067KCU3_JATCU|nr:hypothetical protein JCGZ_18811 [Jatropha curcas]
MISVTRYNYYGLLVTAFVISLLSSSVFAHDGKTREVSYDGRSLIINGKRELLFSGSIHYPRSTPDMWPELITKAKQGGLNVIQTYVFWNIHEPVKGEYHFEGRFDVVKFMKIIQEKGMYATLRLGPFIQAEWNHGGLPYWLREIPNIIFRSYNEPFMNEMVKFITMIIDKMKEEKLFYPQGGPIVLAQIENEYNTVQLAYRELGDKYVQWAGNFALGLNVGVPWVMCKQKNPPGPVINSCNGRHCGDTFVGPDKPNKPYLWTENWTAQFRVFGDPPAQRSAEDAAFSVARWFSKNGSLVNYYMYHGGTNLDRTAASFVTTRYYDEAPLDEFGLQRQPKYGHLKDLHRALGLCKKALFWGSPGVEKLGKDQEVRFYEQPAEKLCAAFLTNNDTREGSFVKFRGKEFYLPPRSISVLPDCKTVVFNSMQVVSQHNSRNFLRSNEANKNLKWEMTSETILTQLKMDSKVPKELYSLTKDTTDYAWYTTVMILNPRDLSMRKDILPVLRVASLGHAMLAFVNGQLDSGAYMEHRFAGPRGVEILGLNTGTLDVSSNGWGHQVGLTGQNEKWYTEEGLKKVTWKEVPQGKGPPLTWYKAYFDAPEGCKPVAISMIGMVKGMIWINGQCIGRYWMSYLSPLGQPTQPEYHIPRSYLKPKNNLVVIMEEEPSNPERIEIVLVDRDTICSFIGESHPPHVKSWARQDNKFIPVLDDVKPAAHLKCPADRKIVAVEFASFGDPYGACGGFIAGNCTSANSKQVVEQHCMGKASCDVPIERELFDKNNDPCPDIRKTLAVQVSDADTVAGKKKGKERKKKERKKERKKKKKKKKKKRGRRRRGGCVGGVEVGRW